ncbi:MAG: peptidoglycan-binding protein [Candidatus Paceibacterota bacterium]
MNKFVRKMTTSAVAVATVVSMSGAAALVPSVASAATVAELEAQIQALLAQLATLTGGSTTTTGGACYTFTRDLTVGSQGQDVMDLQKAMNAMGFTVSTSGAGSAGAESTYFGAKTQAAVAAWQAANAVAPAAGYFGPKSRAAYAASCSTTGSTGSTTLKGGAGSLADADFIASLNGEEVGEDEEDVEVAGLEIEAEGSDIMITAVTLDFDYADSGGDDDFDDYADEVSIWLDGEEVARLDADEFDDDNNYAKTVALDSGAIIEEDEVGELVVAVSGVKNLDSTNAANGDWNVAFEGVRFRDAQTQW